MNKFVLAVCTGVMAFSFAANAGLITDAHVVYTVNGFSGGHVHAGDPGVLGTNGGAALYDELTYLTDYYGDMVENGIYSKPWGPSSLKLSGTEDVNVFELESSVLTGLGTGANLIIDIGATDKAIINVSGSLVNLDYLNIAYGDLHTNRILFNFYEATNLNINGSFFGTVIAKDADVTGKYGNWKGGLFAKSYAGDHGGTHQFYLSSYDLPEPPETPPEENVPEGSSVAYLLVGGVALVLISRKKLIA